MWEHKFVEVGLSTFKRNPEVDYHSVVYEHEKEGWELVQIFVPGIKSYGMPAFCELIFKRKKR